MKVAHEHKIPLIVDNTFGMGGMHSILSVEIKLALTGTFIRVPNSSY